MRRAMLLLAALTGMSGCVWATEPASDAGICLGLRPSVAQLRAGLTAHPETPDAVGEPAADVVIGFEGAC